MNNRCLEGYEKVKVVGARVIIRQHSPEEKTSSGIILAEQAKEPKLEGTVVAIGTGARLENGTLMPMEVSPGDHVIYSRLAGVPIEYKKEKLLVINERDIICTFEKDA